MKEQLLVVDTETGGLDCNKHALLSICIYAPEIQSKVLNKEYFIKEPVVLDSDTVTLNNLKELGNKNKYPNLVTESALSVNNLSIPDLYREGISLNVLDNLYIKHLISTPKYKYKLLGQNLKFDMGFIQVNLPLLYSFLNKYVSHHMELRDFSYMYYLSKFGNTNYSTSLASMRKELNVVSTGEAHTAKADAMDTYSAYTKIVEYFENLNKTLNTGSK